MLPHRWCPCQVEEARRRLESARASEGAEEDRFALGTLRAPRDLKAEFDAEVDGPWGCVCPLFSPCRRRCSLLHFAHCYCYASLSRLTAAFLAVSQACRKTRQISKDMRQPPRGKTSFGSVASLFGCARGRRQQCRRLPDARRAQCQRLGTGTVRGRKASGAERRGGDVIAKLWALPKGRAG